jgi:hypothetical protein
LRVVSVALRVYRNAARNYRRKVVIFRTILADAIGIIDTVRIFVDY